MKYELTYDNDTIEHVTSVYKNGGWIVTHPRYGDSKFMGSEHGPIDIFIKKWAKRNNEKIKKVRSV